MIYHCAAGGSEPVNADAIAYWPIPQGHAYLVCDGIEHTLQTATALAEFCGRLPKADWSYSSELSTRVVQNILNVANQLASTHQGVAFCLSLALVLPDQLLITHSGDCRAGILNEQGITWLTNDDVPTLKLYQNGKLTREQYQQSRHLLSRKLKIGNDNRPALTAAVFPKPTTGSLLLCSDGFWDATEEHLLTGPIVQSFEAIKKVIPTLNESARDNFSVILV